MRSGGFKRAQSGGFEKGSPLAGAMRVYHYTTICRVGTRQYKEAVKTAAQHGLNRHTITQWRKEFFALPEIQQRPAGGKVRVKLSDKRRQKFYDVDRNIWERVGSKRGDCRLMIQAADNAQSTAANN